MTRLDIEKFFAKTKKEHVTRVKGKKAALRHLDRLISKKPFGQPKTINAG